jgi:thioredoxin 1
LSGPLDETETSGDARYEMAMTAEEAGQGTAKILSRQGKKLRVTIPPGVTDGATVRLTNALQVTDGRPGDILIRIKVKAHAETAPGGVIEVNDGSFEEEVLHSALPVVVDFWAPWCGPCRMVAPVTEKLAREYSGRVKFCKINVDENQLAAAKYQAMSIPLLLFFRDGRVVEKSVGAVPESQLKPKVESLL